MCKTSAAKKTGATKETEGACEPSPGSTHRHEMCAIPTVPLAGAAVMSWSEADRLELCDLVAEEYGQQIDGPALHHAVLSSEAPLFLAIGEFRVPEFGGDDDGEFYVERGECIATEFRCANSLQEVVDFLAGLIQADRRWDIGELHVLCGETLTLEWEKLCITRSFVHGSETTLRLLLMDSGSQRDTGDESTWATLQTAKARIR